jgi:hypothetical protein
MSQGTGRAAGPGAAMAAGQESSFPAEHALPENPEHLGADDAARVLREVLAGERRAQLSGAGVGRPLNSVAVGEWPLQAGDAYLVFFVDDASLAHLVTMQLGDGRAGSFETWFARDSANPLELLEEDERLALEQRLREAV